MKTIYILTIILSITCKVFAQHCPLDNAALLVLKIESDSLEVDSITAYIQEQNISDTSAKYKMRLDLNKIIGNKFVVNPSQTHIKNYNEYFKLNNISYSFAKDNLILGLPFSLNKYPYLIIAFKYKNGMDLKTVYYIKPKDFYNLHVAYSNKWPSLFKEIHSPEPDYPFTQLIMVKLNN